jgi:hypothetical protein
MPIYTLFALDPRNSRMDQCAKYEALDDQTALDLARRLSRNRSTELWSEHREVGRFRPPPRFPESDESAPA